MPKGQLLLNYETEIPTSSAPGSLIPGVPASLINATV